MRRSARISDPANDFVGMDAGGAFRELVMEIDGENLLVHMCFAEAPSEEIGTRGDSYRLHVKGDAGEHMWNFAYDPMSDVWSAPGMPVQIEAGDDGFEIAVPPDYVATAAALLPIVRVEARDCSSGSA